MQSKKQKTNSSTQNVSIHVIFIPLMTLTFGLWVLYRALFSFPVWFDETIGKALFFGLPVWAYVTITQFQEVVDSFAVYKLKYGVLMGIVVGGLFGFATSIFTLIQQGGSVMSVELFNAPYFWVEFFLALSTAFWETLLFYALAMTVITHQWKKMEMWQQVMLVALIFVAFHVPNTLLRYPVDLIFPQLVVLFCFAIGQGLLFWQNRNAYTLLLSHAIWGMVLLTHTIG